MKIRSPVIAAGGGSLAGLTLSRNRGGLYLRARATPVNPNTAQQVAIKTIFGNLSTRWAGLTDAQREGWTTYAINVPVTNSLGEQITLTGHQMYIKCNTARVQAGLNEVDDGPIVFSHDILSPVTVVADATADTATMTFEALDDWVNEDDAGLLLYMSRSKSPTINYFKGPYRFTTIVQGDATTPPTSPETGIATIFDVSPGNTTFFKVQSVRADGRVSPIQLLGPIDNV